MQCFQHSVQTYPSQKHGITIWVAIPSICPARKHPGSQDVFAVDAMCGPWGQIYGGKSGEKFIGCFPIPSPCDEFPAIEARTNLLVGGSYFPVSTDWHDMQCI